MDNKILTPYGAKKCLADEFSITRPTLDKMLLGGTVRDNKTKDLVRQRAIELGGVEVINK